MYEMFTDAGTQLFVQADGLVVHSNDKPSSSLPLCVWVPPDSADCCFLLSACSKHLLVRGDALTGTPLSYAVENVLNGTFRLRHPSTGKYLLCDVADPAVSAAGDQGSIFRLIESPSDEALLAKLEPLPTDKPPAGFLAVTSIHRVLQALSNYTAPLIASYLRLLPSDSLRQLIASIAHSSAYASIFPLLKQHLSKQQSDPWIGNTQNALRFWIDNCGYRVGDHTYGAPVIWSGLIYNETTRLEIGKYCAIAGNIDLVMANHNVKFVTTYPFIILQEFWPGVDGSASDHLAKPIVIGNDVWIGAHACILPGTEVGDGAVIAAYSVVRGTIPPYAIVTGNPGRIVGYRFDERTIARLLAVRWWDWPDWKVDAHLNLMMSDDVESFLDSAENAPQDNKQPRQVERQLNVSTVESTNKLKANLAEMISSIDAEDCHSNGKIIEALKIVHKVFERL